MMLRNWNKVVRFLPARCLTNITRTYFTPGELLEDFYTTDFGPQFTIDEKAKTNKTFNQLSKYTNVEDMVSLLETLKSGVDLVNQDHVNYVLGKLVDQPNSLETSRKLVNLLKEKKLSNETSYNYLFHSLFSSGKQSNEIYKQYRQIIAEIKENNVKLGSNTYSTIIQGLSMNGYVDDAFELAVESEANKIIPSKRAFDSLLFSLFDDRKVTKGLQLYEKLKENSQVDINTINFVLNGLLKSKKDRTAEFQAVEKDIDALKLTKNSATLATQILFYKNDKQKVTELTKDQSKDVDPLVFTAALSAHAIHSDRETILQVFDRFEEPDLWPHLPSNFAIEEALQRLSDLGDSEAVAIILAAVEVLQPPTLKMYTIAAECFFKTQELGYLSTLITNLSKSEQTPSLDFFHIMLDFAIYTNNFAEATELISEMKAAGVQPTAETYYKLIVAYSEKGSGEDLEKAGNLLEQMKKDGITPVAESYVALLVSSMKSRDYKRAAPLLKHFSNMNHTTGISADEE